MILLVLGLVAAINFFVDPGGIYYRGLLSNSNLRGYVGELVRQPIGLFGSYGERELKMGLAKYAPTECALVGSSRILQWSRLYTYQSGLPGCQKVINLGVSGGTFEDVVLFVGQLLERENLPKTIVFALDPWVFKFDADLRWKKFESRFVDYVAGFGLEYPEGGQSYKDALLRNLLNREYFLASLAVGLRDGIHYEKARTGQAPKEGADATFEYGFDKPVITLDGAYIYDRKYQNKKRSMAARLETIGWGEYKLALPLQDPGGEENFVRLLKKIRAAGIDVNFFLSPYHPGVFLPRNHKINDLIRAKEKQFRLLAKRLNIPVYGSYDPRLTGCRKEEYFDPIHPNSHCLAKAQSYRQ